MTTKGVCRVLWLMVFVLLNVLTVQAQSQKHTVKGIITGQDGLPIFGVTILEKGTSNGVVSNTEGEYSIDLSTKEAILTFSYVGYLAQEIPVEGRAKIDVVLADDLVSLDEVVVVGFGVEKKVNLSGAVDEVDAEMLTKRPISNISDGLQGAIPGLNVQSNSGAPGTAPRINIRGVTSINGGDPLILIDGIPSSALELNRIAPQDLESISVIKDASAAAIYGARAAFGVVTVTTKSGAKGKGVQINYTTYSSFNKPTVLPEKVTDPYIYSRLLETSTDNTPWDNVNYSDEFYKWAKERSDDPSIAAVRVNPNDPSSWEYMGNKDWSREFMKDATYSFNHDLSISGGDDRTTYLLSGSYSRQDGLVTLADDYFDRYTVRAKINMRAKDWLTIGNNTYLVTTKRENPSYFDITGIYNLHPTDMDKNPDGTWANSGAGLVAARLTDGGQNQEEYTSLQSQFTLKAEILKDRLFWNTDFTYRRGRSDQNWYRTKYSIGYGPEDIREEGENVAYRYNGIENYYVFNTYANYLQNFGKHDVKVVAGFNQEFSRFNSFNAERRQLISASLPTIALGTGDQLVDENVSEWAIRGLFYRLNYIYNNKYIVEFNGRYDGSSKFPSDNRWSFVPSASVAWKVDEEAFMDQFEAISQLKFRASIGTLGNQAIAPYSYIATMDAYQGNYIIGGERTLEIGAPGLVSSDFTWEKVTTKNIGVDLGFFMDRLSMSFDYFRRDTKDMLTLGKELPDVLGATEPQENAADLKTNGWELAVSYQNSIEVADRNLSFKLGFNLSDSRSYITRFDNPNGSITQFYEGMELGEIWGLQSDGLFKTQDEIDALDQTSIIPWGALTIVPGWPKYKDLDGNGIIEKGYNLNDTKDLSVIGNQAPRYRYGININMEYAGFDFSGFLQGVGKRDYYPLDYLYWGFYQQPYAGGYDHLFDFYRAADESAADRARHSQSYLDAGLADANPNAFYPVLQSWLADRNLGERIDEAQGLAIPQTRYMLDASYLRLKNITIGYTLPRETVERIGVGNVRIYVSGENLFEWSDVKDFFDPEAINDAVEYNPAVSKARGVGKGYSYPFQRRYVVGLNVSF